MCKGNYSICPIRPELFASKFSSSATPGKQCLPPKVSVGGLRDRTHVEYSTCVKGSTVFAQSFHSKRQIRGQSIAFGAALNFQRKQCFAPKSVSLGMERLRDTVIPLYTCSIFNRARQQTMLSGGCSAVLIFSNPRKAMFAPKKCV